MASEIASEIADGWLDQSCDSDWIVKAGRRRGVALANMIDAAIRSALERQREAIAADFEARHYKMHARDIRSMPLVCDEATSPTTVVLQTDFYKRLSESAKDDPGGFHNPPCVGDTMIIGTPPTPSTQTSAPDDDTVPSVPPVRTR